jgi:hypothetical protein
VSGVFKAVASVAAVAAMLDPEPISKAILTAVAVVASIGAAVTQKPPPAVGSATQVTIGANQPTPYVIGRTFYAGAEIFDLGYGATLDGVKNPYSSSGRIWSLGPIESFEAFQCDFTTVPFTGGTSGAATGYYGGFMHLATQLGACPEAAALAGPWSAIPGWGASSKLSGLAAGIWSNKFDRKGKVYASGLPPAGMILRGPKAYDARLDSTYPGGEGGCRPLQEDTYVGGAVSENPGCAAVTYAMGRFQNGVKVFGPAFAPDTIDWPAWIAFSNVCDANGWKAGGIIFEGPGVSRWDNLKRICAAGAAEPVFLGGLLSVRYSAPKVALDTITEADLADGEIRIAGMKTWTQRLNAIVPKYKSELNHWDYVQSKEVSVDSYVAADGEEKSEEHTYELCQQQNQSAQLAGYELVNGRELGPIVLPLKPRLSRYRPGEALNVNLPKLGLVNRLCTITIRHRDPGKFMVTLTLETETSSKHPFALGQTGTAPPPPALSTGEDRDAIVSAGRDANAAKTAARIVSQTVAYPTTSNANSITVSAFDAVLSDGTNYSFPAGTVGSLAESSIYGLFRDRSAAAYLTPIAPAAAEMADGDNVFIGWVATSSSTTGDYPTPPTPPGGWGGGGRFPLTADP